MSLWEEFKSENWDKKSNEQKAELLQRLENNAAKEQGRIPRAIRLKEMSDLGSYSMDDPQYINVNSKSLSRTGEYRKNFLAMDTVLHEGRHAYQDDAIKGRIEPKGESKAKIQSWAHNFPNIGGIYNDGGNNSTIQEYRFQPIEDDANAYAHQKISSHQDLFAKDSSYKNYISDVNSWDKYMSEVAKADYGKNYKKRIANSVERRYQKRENNRNNSIVNKGDNTMSYDMRTDLQGKTNVSGQQSTSSNSEGQNRSGNMRELLSKQTYTEKQAAKNQIKRESSQKKASSSSGNHEPPVKEISRQPAHNKSKSQGQAR